MSLLNYFQYDDLVGKYRDVANAFDANAVGSWWGPGAEAIVDGYLGNTGYTVPFSPVPPLVKDLAIDMCYYRMTYRSQNQEILKKYLDDIFTAIGKLQLDITVGGVTLAAPSQVFLTNSYGSSFGMDDSTRFRVDSGWQQQFAGDRGDWAP